jgi:hypothetical protein
LRRMKCFHAFAVEFGHGEFAHGAKIGRNGCLPLAAGN